MKEGEFKTRQQLFGRVWDIKMRRGHTYAWAMTIKFIEHWHDEEPMKVNLWLTVNVEEGNYYLSQGVTADWVSPRKTRWIEAFADGDVLGGMTTEVDDLVLVTLRHVWDAQDFFRDLVNLAKANLDEML